MNLEYNLIAATDIGRVRSANEDCLRILPSMNLAVIADGLGGHQGGAVASRMAVDAVCERFEERIPVPGEMPRHDILRDVMIDAMSHANHRVYAGAHQRSEWEGMGTTLLATSFQPGHLEVGHVGDSRLYRFREGELIQLTTDHTLASALQSANPHQKPPAESYHVLQKAVGIDMVCRPDFLSFSPGENEIYLLCTDGLSGVLSHREIEDILTQYAQQPERCAQTLIASCLDQGAPDNVSLVLVFVSGMD